MTEIDDYRAYLKAQLKSAQSILDDAMKRKADGEITKSSYVSMWKREIINIRGKLDVEQSNPELFAEEASIWQKRMAFPLH